MGNYETEIEYYLVVYNGLKEKRFDNEEDAVKFAKQIYENGYLVSIKQIRHLVDWI